MSIERLVTCIRNNQTQDKDYFVDMLKSATPVNLSTVTFEVTPGQPETTTSLMLYLLKHRLDMLIFLLKHLKQNHPSGWLDVSHQYGPTKGTLLHHCVFAQNFEALKLLLEHPAIKLDWRDAHGNTPLHLAAQQEVEDLPPFLLALRREKDNALQILLSSRRCETRHLQATNNRGETPLDSAIASGHSKQVQMLLDQQPDLTVPLSKLDRFQAAHQAALKPLLTRHNARANLIIKINDYQENLRQRESAFAPRFWLFFFTIPGLRGYSKSDKLMASEILKQVLLGHDEASSLQAWSGPLNNGRLGGLYAEVHESQLLEKPSAANAKP